MTSGLTPDDLKSAVEAGVIDAAQAEKLRAMRGAAPTDSVLADEEHFRFLNGFNDVFLTIGVLLVAGAFLFAAMPTFSGSGWLSVVTFAAVTFWLLSELLVRRLRAVLPGMALAILFTIFAAAAFVIEYHSDRFAAPNWDFNSELAFWRNPTLLFAAPALAASLVYYLRFRLPFTLALIACFGYVVVSKIVLMTAGIASPFVGFAYGLFVLAIALAYDSRDPKRVTRFSDCAFWLHLVAAWLIVSPLIAEVKHASGDSTASMAVLVTVLLLGIFALIIDRRALLVSSLFSFTIAVYGILGGGTRLPVGGYMPSSFITTLALVGGFVLILGVFWHPLRQRLMPLFRNMPFARYLPPAEQ